MKKILISLFLYHFIINTSLFCQENKSVFLDFCIDLQDKDTENISIIFISQQDSLKLSLVSDETFTIPQEFINKEKVSLIFLHNNYAILFENIPVKYILPFPEQKFIYWDLRLYREYLKHYPELPVIDELSYTFAVKALEFPPEKIWKTK